MQCESENYLAHHGILGQKWGIRRYQNRDGSLTAEGRKRAGLKPESKREKRKKEAAKQKAEKKAAKDLKDKENLKTYLRKHPKKLYKHASELTREEAEEIIKNVEFDRKLKDIRDSEVQRTWKQISNISSNAQTLANLMNTGKSIYNSAAEINNLFVESGKSKGSRMLKLGEKAETKEDTSWFDTNLKKSNYEELLKDTSKLTNSQMTEINKRFTQEELLRKNLADIGYQGKHVKHGLVAEFKEIV